MPLLPLLPNLNIQGEKLKMETKKNIEKINAHGLKKDKILKALTTAKDISEASQIAGVSRKTIYSYLKDKDFIIAYRNLKNTELREVSEKISFGASYAADFLINILNDTTAKQNTKLHASIKLLDFYSKFVNIETSINSTILKESENLFDIFSFSSGL